MRPLTMKRQLLGAVLAFAALSACSGKDATPSPQDSKADDATKVAQQIYKGLENSKLGAHTATFHVEFQPSDGSTGWTYDVDISKGESAGSLRRDLKMDGLPANIDAGDLSLISAEGQQYMIGEAVGVSRCLLFPASVDLDDSFLTPDSFIEPIDLTDASLSKTSVVTVAGQEGTTYALPAQIGDFSNAQGAIVIAKDGSVLRYTLSGDTVDNTMLSGVAGHMQWNYEVTNIGASEAISAPADCVIDLPLMPDAENLAKLPSLIEYETDSTLEEVTAFYQAELPKLGWGVLEFPQILDEVTVLTYALEGRILSVSVQTEGSKQKVQLYTEER